MLFKLTNNSFSFVFEVSLIPNIKSPNYLVILNTCSLFFLRTRCFDDVFNPLPNASARGHEDETYGTTNVDSNFHHLLAANDESVNNFFLCDVNKARHAPIARQPKQWKSHTRERVKKDPHHVALRVEYRWVATDGLPRKTIVGKFERTNEFESHEMEGKNVERVVANVDERTLHNGFLAVDKCASIGNG